MCLCVQTTPVTPHYVKVAERQNKLQYKIAPNNFIWQRLDNCSLKSDENRCLIIEYR
uniref:Uncharacterized protein n=1 Tax=Anguilla anguilla TaxID=7936 RepID=A0A0E9WL60_ANGAN